MGGWGTSTSTTDTPTTETTPGPNNNTYSCHPSLNDWGCCTNAAPCGLGTGDCDYDSECAGNLVCGDDNCAAGSPNLDCCMDPASNNTASCDPALNNWSCCTVSAPCGDGQGDCDGDNDCAGDLVCGLNNCEAGDGEMDCCTVATTTTANTNTYLSSAPTPTVNNNA